MSNKRSNDRLVRSRLVLGVVWGTVLQPLIIILGLASSVIVARALGPDLLAVVSAIAAVSAGTIAFSDLGLSHSMGKLLPDLSVKYGKSSALAVARWILYVRIGLVVGAFVVLTTLHVAGAMNIGGKIDLSCWFFVLFLARVLIGTTTTVQQSSGLAAFRNRELYYIDLVLAVLDPLVTIAVVLVFCDPYVVVGAGALVELLRLLLLRRFVSYDLDADHEAAPQPLKAVQVVRDYGLYIFTTYVVFMFNRFLIGLPMAFIILTALGQSPSVIANAAMSVTIVATAWMLTNIPLTNLRGPLLARMFAQGDERRFQETQRLMISILVITSAVVLLGIQTVGVPVLQSLYGHKYLAGVEWGATVILPALIGNMFCMGNSTFHQRNQYRQELIGFGLALIVIVAGVVVSVACLSEERWCLAVLLSLVGGRCAFWVLTDVWADWVLFRWEGSGIKFRGVLAASLGLVAARCAPAGESAWTLHFASCASAMCVFWAVFRITGGVGTRTREIVRGLLPPRYRPAAALL